jgi:S-DNA-T family DNA segregation ATPase FtsK/SpoIIIE
MVTFDPGDWPSPNQYPHHSPSANACGIVGAWCAYQLRFYVGYGAYPLLLFMTLAALIRLFRGRVDHVWSRAFGLALFVTCTSASAHLLTEPAAGSLPVGHGGVIGFSLGEFFRQNLDRTGTAIVFVACLLVGLLFATEGWVLKVPGAVKRLGRASGGVAGLARSAATATVLRPISPGQSVTAEESAALLRSDGASVRPPAARPRRQARGATARQPTLFDDEGLEDQEPPADESGSDVGDGYADDDSEPAAGLSENAAATGPGGRKKAAKKPTRPIVRFASPQQVVGEPYPREIENWRLPSLDLLHESEYGFTDQQEQFVRKQALVLEQTLKEFRLDARVVEIDTGPVITMFELKLGAGIKVSQIATLSNDIARALRAHAIRVVAPISGKNTVGIEVPNSEKEKVRLRELMTLAGQRASDMRLPLFLGKDAGGRPLVADLTEMPHLLIAGTTGSGKSVCLNAITLSLLMTQRPDHVKLILIDPKMVEMSQFKSVPHLMCPIVTDLVRAEKILEWAVMQMDERYELIAEAHVKNVAGYNSLGADALYERIRPESKAEKSRIPTRLPHIVVVIDELADLMMTAAKKVEHHLSRLAQKSRAVGVHIIVATQRPEAKVVTGLVKSNLPSRICFRVASRMDSRIVLDQNGGEVLLGQGDMLFLPPGSHKLIRAQGTFLEEAEMRAVLHDLASRAKPEFHPELVRLRRPGSSGADMQRDPLFDPAVGIIVQSQRGSVSLLQRRLTIGYSRASRLIDQMAQAGIIGDYKGSQAREVLMTPGQWEALREQVATEVEEGYQADQEGIEEGKNGDRDGVRSGHSRQT